MSENKRYYYMKLENNYFDLKMQKALRKQANGANMTIVYLKLQLKSLSNNGIIYFEGLYPTLAEELAVDIDEALVDVQITLAFLEKYGVIKQLGESEFYIEEMQHRVGSVTDSGLRMQKLREKNKKELGAQSDAILDIERAKDIINNKEINSACTHDIINNINDYYINLQGENKKLADEIINTFINFANDCIFSNQDKVYFSHNWYSLQDINSVLDSFDANTLCRVMTRIKTNNNIQDRKHYIIATVLGIVLNK